MRKLNPRFDRETHTLGAVPIKVDGKIYNFKPYDVLVKTHRTEKNRKEYRRTCYEIIPEDMEQPVGFVSEMTTDDRIESLIRRVKNPCHFEPFSFVGTVRTIKSQKKKNFEKQTTRSRTYYVCIPRDIVKKKGILVDDEISYQLELIPEDPEKPIKKLTSPDGKTEFYYHVGKYGNNLVINLKKYRKSCIKKGEKSEILAGSRIRVNVSPHPSPRGRIDITPMISRPADDD